MFSTAYDVYKTANPKLKDPIWANNCITVLRRDWRPLVNQVRCRENKKLLDSMQSMEYIKEHFKDKEFKDHMEWDPLGIMEVFKNILTEDIMRDPPKAELKAVDPTAISDRKNDLKKLQNRSIVEKDVNTYRSQVMPGMPKYKYGAGKFKSNIDEFESLGLDEKNKEDLTFFEQELQRLNYEVAGQNVINSIFKLCRFDMDICRKVVRDILAAKALSVQVYVDKMSGEVKCRYLYPETFRGIFGDSGDGRNDICKGWVDNVSVTEWLQLVGNEFEWDRDWKKLLWAINFCGQTKYTGFIRAHNLTYDCCGNENLMKEAGVDKDWKSSLIEWTMAFSYQVQVGYIEWKTEEATSTWLKNKDIEAYTDVIPYEYELKEKEIVDGFYKDSFYQQQMYGSYFIATSTTSQWIFGYSKVYYQNLRGANDEYADGTLHYILYEGLSAAEIAKPYIRAANEIFFKMLWLLDKAKPEEDVYVYEEIVQIAKTFMRAFPQNNGGATPTLDSIIKQVILFQKENFIKMRSYPQIEGKTIMQLPTLEGKRNGLDPLFSSFLPVLGWFEAQIGAKIGVNPMRTGMNPPSRESEKSEMNTVNSSIEATSYIYRMIQDVKMRCGTSILLFSQLIIRYKDSLPYRWLLRLIGEEDFQSLYLLGDYAAHRFALYIDDYNMNSLKQKIMQAADMALAQKQISIDQWGLVLGAEDPKKALKLLSLYKRKQEQKLRKQALEDMKVKQEGEQQIEQMKHKNKMEELQMELEKAKIEAGGLVKSAEIQSDGRIKVKEITVDAEGAKQADKAQASKEVNTSKEKDKESKPFPAVAGGQ